MSFRKKGLIVASVGVVVVVGSIVAAVIYGGDESAPEPSSTSDMVKIEMRAMPTAEIRVDGKHVGSTPLALSYPRSNKEIRIEATMMRHWVKRGAQKDEKFVDRRTVTLDRDRLLDFKVSTAKLEDSGE